MYGILDKLTEEDLQDWTWNGPIDREILLEVMLDAIENAGLTEKQREVIMLRFFEGLTYFIIGKRMGFSKQMAHRHKVTAISKLRRYLNNHE